MGVFSKLFIFYIFIFALLLQTPDAFSKSQTKSGVKPARTVAAQPGITYSLEPKLKWQRFDLLDFEKNNYQIYHLQEDQNIILKLSFYHEDLLSEYTKNGPNKTVEEIIRSKSEALSALGVNRIKLINNNTAEFKQGKILILRTQYSNSNNQIETIDKYFMFPNETLLISLSWNSSSNAKIIESAINDMGNIKVDWSPSQLPLEKVGPK